MGLEVCLQHSEECGVFYKSLRSLKTYFRAGARVLAVELGLPWLAVGAILQWSLTMEHYKCLFETL